MASTITFPNAYLKKIFDGSIDLVNDTIKVMFLDSNHTNDVDAHEFIDDVSANEVSASGTYSAGGVTLTFTNSQDNTDNEGVADCADFSVTSFTGSVRTLCYYKDTGTPSTSPIIAFETFTTDQSANNGTWAYTVATEGLFNAVSA